MSRRHSPLGPRPAVSRWTREAVRLAGWRGLSGPDRVLAEQVRRSGPDDIGTHVVGRAVLARWAILGGTGAARRLGRAVERAARAVRAAGVAVHGAVDRWLLALALVAALLAPIAGELAVQASAYIEWLAMGGDKSGQVVAGWALIGLALAVWMLLPPWRDRAGWVGIGLFNLMVCPLTLWWLWSMQPEPEPARPASVGWLDPWGTDPDFEPPRSHFRKLEPASIEVDGAVYFVYLLWAGEPEPGSRHWSDDYDTWGNALIAWDGGPADGSADQRRFDSRPLSLLRLGGFEVGEGQLCDTDGTEAGIIWRSVQYSTPAGEMYFYRIADPYAESLDMLPVPDFWERFPVCKPE